MYKYELTKHDDSVIISSVSIKDYALIEDTDTICWGTDFYKVESPYLTDRGAIMFSRKQLSIEEAKDLLRNHIVNMLIQKQINIGLEIEFWKEVEVV